MLNWDDEPQAAAQPKPAQPQVAPQAQAGLQAVAASQPAASQPTAGHLGAVAHPPTNPGAAGATGLDEVEMGASRIQVDDKKIINCKADLNQLVPFKYKWAWEK